MRELALCAGVGMLSEGIKLACASLGVPYELKAVAETDNFCSQILKRYQVPNLGDVNNIDNFAPDSAELISAGFPCQPWSKAGKKKGFADERNILGAIFQIIAKVRPQLVFFENVTSVHKALGFILNEFSTLGFNAEWSNLSASTVGAKHQRRRWFLLAYTPSARLEIGKSERANFGQKCETAERISNSAPIFPLFAPERNTDFGQYPEWLRPAIKPKLFRMVNGVATGMDDNRKSRLIAIGNGVVPSQAAFAFRGLTRRAGLVA